MLEELSIQNLALVDRLVLRFTSGFQVLTGETGAGKSILVGALSLLHGGRADTESIRTGADEAVVSGVFLVDEDGEAAEWLRQRGIEIEEGGVIVRRSVRRTGRGSIYIQSSPVTRADLAEFASYIFDLHGQHEHQSLLASDQQRRLLDRYAGIEHRVAEFSRSFSDLSERKKHFDRMLAGEREQLREREFLEFAVSEIDSATLKPGEEEELEQERRMLAEHERVFALLEDSYGGLAENRGGALASLRRVRDAVDALSEIDPAMAPHAKRLEDSFFELEDISEQIRDYHSGIVFRPERVEECNERLSLIHKLEKKYGIDISEVLRYRDEAAERISGFETWEEDKERLSAELSAAEKAVRTEAQAISELRRAAGERLAAAITEVVQRLGLQRARFAAAVTARSGENGKPVCGASGLDQVEFQIAANLGEPLKPLASVASGGEVSRIMLAVKTVLAESDRVGMLVFDEIDAGIGGEVALAVGEHLQELASQKQVLCITHLASIAVRADNHMRVEKQVRDNRTLTDCVRVEGEERRDEIARMLAGDTTGAVSREHAEELLRRYAHHSG